MSTLRALVACLLAISALCKANWVGGSLRKVALLETDSERFAHIAENFLNIPQPPEHICLGNDTGAPCINPWTCTSGASKKPAITFAFDEAIPWAYNTSWYRSMRNAADAMGADLVLLLPAKEAPLDNNCTFGNTFSALLMALGVCSEFERVEIPGHELLEIKKYFKIVRVPWVVPPGLSRFVPRDGGCCGAREFMKLHAFALEEYDAVINLDTDFTVHGSLRPLFDCAASGQLLTARGSVSGVNGGMFAVRPSKALLAEVLRELQASSASYEHGWNLRGLAPGASTKSQYGQAGFQGFMYYYFYQRGADSSVIVGQVDPCKWTGAVFCNSAACDVTPLRHKIHCDNAE